MRSGQLRHSISIVGFNDHAVDDFGVVTPVWQRIATVRAEIIQQTATEFLTSQGASETVLLIFRTRFVCNITNANQIIFEGKDYKIKEVVTIGNNRGLELRAEEVQL